MTASDAMRAADTPDGFRPDLEGLRAVAVVLVLLYHAQVPRFSGGYVGVDVFFVLSGFLITGLLLREVRRTGTISLPGFYARRARRLLPASALVLVVTLVASIFMMPPLRVPDVAGDAASAALYVSNMRFALQATDYLAAEVAPSPLLHFWSLSAEEQFYLFWPAIILLITRARADPGRRVGVAAALIAVVSFGLSVWLTQANQPWAFFSLPTRAWELGLGALLAIGAVRLARIPARPAAVAAWIGLVMVGMSGIVLSTSTPFPGVAALLPTVGSALMIAGGFRQSALAPGRWLSTAVPRFFGRISYSLYLWHWPLLVLPVAALDRELPWWARGALVLLAIALAAGTQRWVEDPFRHGLRIGTLPRRNLAMAGALTLLVAAFSVGVAVSTTTALAGSGATSDLAGDEAELDRILGTAATPALPATPGGPVPAALRPPLGAARTDLPLTYVDGCNATQDATESGACTYGDPASATTVVLLGDSHAMSWFPAVNRLAVERGWRLVNLTKSACGAADVLQYNVNFKRAYTECDAWRESSFRRIESEHPALVLVASSRAFHAAGADGTSDVTGVDGVEPWRAGMDRTLRRLAGAAGSVVLIGDTPRSDVDVPVCLSAHRDDVLACATPVEDAISRSWLANERAVAAKTGVGFVDPTPWVCPSSPCPAVIGNYMVFRDEHHLTTQFATALGRRLGDALPALATKP